MSLRTARSWRLSGPISASVNAAVVAGSVICPRSSYMTNCPRRFATTFASSDVRESASVRNIGIIAHIDAGKTTTTERMLFFSGFTRCIGNVDEGSTVTDFLPQERARGVTIQSAAISFVWPPQTSGVERTEINLIDTPGHADFTFEVVRSLRILDGAVCILDAVAGVEAQTEKVWRQAVQYHIPRIIFVNKLDRDGASFASTVQQVATRLRTYPLVCQIPWWCKGVLQGVGDPIGMKAIRWNGGNMQSLGHDADPNFGDEIRKARQALIEALSERDEGLVEKYLEKGDVSETDLWQSIRRCTLDQLISPIFAGASFRNIGVEPLLDAVVRCLPTPAEAVDPEIALNGRETTMSVLKLDNGHAKKAGPSLEACALAFKVVHHARKGMLVYVRVYSGCLHARSMIFNTNLQVAERAPQLLKMYASESKPIAAISQGQIGVILGLKHVRTGDTLLSYKGAKMPPEPLNSLQLRPIQVPPAVFFASIEPHNLGEKNSVRTALELLVREDPSLQINEDEESGQTLLSGMGEFHLEIAADRLVNELKAKASVGSIEIAYRETLLRSANPTSDQGNPEAIKVLVAPCKEQQPDIDAILDDGNQIVICISDEAVSAGPPISVLRKALSNGALAALSRGINFPYKFHNVHVTLLVNEMKDTFGSDATVSTITSAAKLATRAALNGSASKDGSGLMELVMKARIEVEEEHLGVIVNDITSARGGTILGLDEGLDGQSKESPIDIKSVYTPPDPFASVSSGSVGAYPPISPAITSVPGRRRTILARVPLREMIGYLKHLRSLTGGRGAFTMAPDRFERVVGQREKTLIQEVRGY